MNHTFRTRSALIRAAEAGISRERRNPADDLADAIIGWSCVAGLFALAAGIFMGWL